MSTHMFKDSIAFKFELMPFEIKSSFQIDPKTPLAEFKEEKRN